MQKILNICTATTLLSMKVFLLFCIAGMGWNNASAENNIKVPCHQIQEDRTVVFKDCHTCQDSLEILEQELITQQELEIQNLSDLVESIYQQQTEPLVRNLKNTDFTFYRPPPKAIYNNAFYHPKAIIVLVI